MPTSMSGNGRAGGPGRRWLRSRRCGPRPVDIAVEAHDERLTTVTAQRALAGAKVAKGDRRGLVDQVAAAVMLQSWLDAPAG